MSREFGFIVIRQKDGSIVIYGGFDLFFKPLRINKIDSMK